jgi:hypothetical protein
MEAKFKAEPVTFLLVNAMRLLSNEQRLSLISALQERTEPVQQETKTLCIVSMLDSDPVLREKYEGKRDDYKKEE